jgi:putative restriction endonuclease
MKFWVGTTDPDWFGFLSSRGFDEVNFWQPSSLAPFRSADLGLPFLFKLKKPYNHIAGGGFFVGHSAIPLPLAWDIFGAKNGAATFGELQQRLHLLKRGSSDRLQAIGCQILSSPVFLPREQWLAEPPGWSPNIVRGRMYDTTEPDGAAIWGAIGAQMTWDGMALAQETLDHSATRLATADVARFGTEVAVRPRLGQGAFRVLLTDLYKRRCAITGESTLPALEAAHIVPYAEHGTHEIQNGLLLRADFHKLFDMGLVGVTPDLKIRISPRIRNEWFNGKAYYRLDGEPLSVLPDNPRDKPDPDRLAWHIHHVFQA